MNEYQARRKALLAYILNAGSMSPRDVMGLLDITQEAARMILLRLHRAGWLTRRREKVFHAEYRYEPSVKCRRQLGTYHAEE